MVIELGEQPFGRKTTLGTPPVSKYAGLGETFNPEPFLPPPVAEGPLKWRWFPFRAKFSISALIAFLGTVCFGVAIILFSPVVGGVGGGIGGFIFLLLSIACFYLVYIVHWNFRLREAMCYVLGKKQQALEVWEEATDKAYAKDVFHIEKLGGVELRVLRDGSTEARQPTQGQEPPGNAAGGSVGEINVNMQFGEAGDACEAV